MKIVLLERVEKLGFMGDIVDVKPGYARNYLLPEKKALRASEENIKLFETRKKEYEAANLARKSDAEKLAAKMKDLSIAIIRQAAESGQLYGSVTGRDVSAAVIDAGYSIERRQVVLDQPFKHVGTYQVRVSLHPDVSVTVKVTIARSQEEAIRTEEEAKTPVESPAEAPAATEEAKPEQKPRAKKKPKEDVE